MTATLDAPRTKKDPTTVTLTIARQALRTALTRLSGAVGSGVKALPVTHHIKLDVQPGSCTFTATDFDTWARLTIPCEASGLTVALLPAKRLAEIVANLPPVATVQLVLSERKGVLTAGRTRFEIASLGVSEFPLDLNVESAARVVVNAQAFLSAIERVVTHASTEESRPNLNVVRLEPVGETITATSIDGHRIAHLIVPATGGTLARGCSLHRLAVPMLARLFAGLAADATLSIGVEESRLSVEGADATAIMRLADNNFPGYRQMLDGHVPTRTVVCDRVLLAAAIRRVALASDEQSHRVVIALADEIAVRASGEAGSGADVVKIERQEPDAGPADRETRTFAINANYTLAALDVLTTDSVAIALHSPERAILFRPDDRSDSTVALVMPLRLL